MPALTVEERIRRLREYERTRTPEDLEIEAREEEDDERYLASLDPTEPVIPIDEVWRLLPGESIRDPKGD